jgi:glycosyltransferase involved in cell wall biosynthesis
VGAQPLNPSPAEAMSETSQRPNISIIVPLKNEAQSIGPLIDETKGALDSLGRSYEIVLVDDGSDDGTWSAIRALADEDTRLIAIRFRRNCGQTAALSAGFDYSRGETIIPMDGDGQNDPADIPRLLEKLAEGCDVVSGWRRKRRDPVLTRILPSVLANQLISLVSGVKLHDYGCTLKAYRRDVVKDVRLYGEMHRFIPIYAAWQGAQTAELEVHHRSRIHGKSKYGILRTIKVILDLIVIKFLSDYLHKPIYLFGGLGLASGVAGFLSGTLAVYLRVVEGKFFIETPLPLLTVFLLGLGALFVMMGILAEIMVRTYYESQRKTTYRVKEIINDPGHAG